jgi:hypothetical protein
MGTYFCDTSQRRVRLDESIRSIAQLLHLIRSETVRPLLRTLLEILSFPHCRSSNLLGKLRVRSDLVVVGRRLAASLDAIGENVRRRLFV